MNTSIEIQIYFYDSLVIIRKLFSVFLVTSLSTSYASPFVSQKENKRREFKTEMEKSKVTLRKVIHKR